MKRLEDTKTYKWLIVFLLFLFMSLNLADRAVLGLTAQQIMAELNLTPKQFGLIGSSFYLLFSLSTFINGFVVDKSSAKKAILYMALVWSVAQLPMIFSSSLVMIYLSRILLGAGEGPAYFIALHAIFKWFPVGKRALPAALVAQGSAFGLIIFLPLLGLLVSHYSWRSAYAVLMVSSLIWVVVWAIYGKDGSTDLVSEPSSNKIIPDKTIRQMILEPTIVATIITSFAANWTFSILIIWFTPFLIAGLGLSTTSASFISALPWVSASILSLSASWLSHRSSDKGYSNYLAPGFIASTSVILGGLALVTVPYISSLWIKILLAVIGTSAPMLVFIFAPTLLSELVHEKRRGALLGVNTSIVSLAAIISPFVMGSFVQEGVSAEIGYMRGLFVCGLILLIGGAVGLKFIKPEKTLHKVI